MDEQPDSPNMIMQFLRKRECLPDKSRAALSEGVIKAFNVVGLT